MNFVCCHSFPLQVLQSVGELCLGSVQGIDPVH